MGFDKKQGSDLIDLRQTKGIGEFDFWSFLKNFEADTASKQPSEVRSVLLFSSMDSATPAFIQEMKPSGDCSI